MADRISFVYLQLLWNSVGGPPAESQKAAAVATAESGGDPNATNSNDNGTIDRGLWQINSIHGAQSTFDIENNVRAAVAISNGGKDWSPWCTAWSDGACGADGGAPPPPGGLNPASPAGRILAQVQKGGVASGDKPLLPKLPNLPFGEGGTAKASGKDGKCKYRTPAITPGVGPVHQTVFPSLCWDKPLAILAIAGAGLLAFGGVAVIVAGVLKGTGAGRSAQQAAQAVPMVRVVTARAVRRPGAPTASAPA